MKRLLPLLVACAAGTKSLPNEVTVGGAGIPSVTLPAAPDDAGGMNMPLAVGTKIGNTDLFSGQSTHAANTLLGSPIEVPRRGTLAAFGVISVPKAAYPSIVMALYSDRNGSPDTLVIFSKPAKLTGSDQQIVPAERTELAPGPYWIVGVYDDVGSIGIDYSDGSASVAHGPLTFGKLPPPVFPTPTSYYAGQRFNYYLVMR